MDGYHEIKSRWKDAVNEGGSAHAAVAFNDVCYLIDQIEACQKKLLLTQRCVEDMLACTERLEMLLL